LQSLAHEELPDSLSSDPAAQASARDVLRRVEAAMERLPLRQRSALHLRSVEGFDYAEIARVLETSEGAVRNAVMHARQKLRERLGDLL
jgi:RNA polymerase sigma-70 factor (ECF subfamily)